jgi:hypothetical protein
METWQYVSLLGVCWLAAIFVLRRWMSWILSFDVACAAMLLYLMVMSAINDEYSLKYLGGGF